MEKITTYSIKPNNGKIVGGIFNSMPEVFKELKRLSISTDDVRIESVTRNVKMKKTKVNQNKLTQFFNITEVKPRHIEVVSISDEEVRNFCELLNNNWNSIIKSYNEHVPVFMNALTRGQSDFKTYFRNRKAEEKTKQLNTVFYQTMTFILKDSLLKENEINGSDFLYNNHLPIEAKITASNGNGWTGNGYPKTNWHLLIRLELNEDGLVDKSAVYLIPIDECKSNWTTPKESANFSSLTLLSEDIGKIIVIHGDFKENKKFLKPILK